MVVSLIITNHTQKPTRSIQTVVMDIRLSVVMMINIVNNNKFIEVKKLYINLLKLCWRKSNIVKML